MTVIELIDYLKQFDENLLVEISAVIGFDIVENEIRKENISVENNKVLFTCD